VVPWVTTSDRFDCIDAHLLYPVTMDLPSYTLHVGAVGDRIHTDTGDKAVLFGHFLPCSEHNKRNNVFIMFFMWSFIILVAYSTAEKFCILLTKHRERWFWQCCCCILVNAMGNNIVFYSLAFSYFTAACFFFLFNSFSTSSKPCLL
jgi:hypothetical protein